MVRSEMNCKAILSIAMLQAVLLPASSAHQCSLRDLSVTPRSSYVIYGVCHDGHVFHFSDVDTTAVNRTVDQYVKDITAKWTLCMKPSRHSIFRVIMTEMHGALHVILARRSHKSNSLQSDANAVPVSTHLVDLGDQRHNIETDQIHVLLFTVPDTPRSPYYIEHSDELGLLAGFYHWSKLAKITIQGTMGNLEVRVRNVMRPVGFSYADVSRMWNGEEGVSGGIEHMGMEWRNAFRRRSSMRECLTTKGNPFNDLHLLWSGGRNVIKAYYRLHHDNQLLDWDECVINGRSKLFDQVTFAGIRNGILFICPPEARMVSVNQMYNEASRYSQQNPDLTNLELSGNGKIYLLSQHHKEVIVVVVTEKALYFRAFPSAGSSLSSYTIDVKSFMEITSCRLTMGGSKLQYVELYNNTLLVLYPSQTLRIDIATLAHLLVLDAEKEKFSSSSILDTFTGEFAFRNYRGQLQLFNGQVTYKTASHFRYFSNEHDQATTTVDLARSHFDALLILRRGNQMEKGPEWLFGLKGCTLFVTREPSLKFKDGDGSLRCNIDTSVRAFIQKSHIVVLVQKMGDNNIYYSSFKVVLQPGERMWRRNVNIYQMWKTKVLADNAIDVVTPQMCVVKGYKIVCYIEVKSEDRITCDRHAFITDWSTGIRKLEKVSNGKCQDVVALHLKDEKEIIAQNRAEGYERTRYFEYDDPSEVVSPPCTEVQFAKYPAEYNPIVTSWVRDRVVARVACNNASRCDANRTDVKFESCDASTGQSEPIVENGKTQFLDYVAVSGERLEVFNKGSSMFGHFNNTHLQYPVVDEDDAERINKPHGSEDLSDDSTELDKHLVDRDSQASDDQTNCQVWQKVATVATLCVMVCEVLALIVSVTLVQCVARPSVRAIREKLGKSKKRKKMTMRKRAMKRFRKLKMQKLRARRRELLRKRRRSEEKDRREANSEASTTSSSSLSDRRSSHSARSVPSAHATRGTSTADPKSTHTTTHNPDTDQTNQHKPTIIHPAPSVGTAYDQVEIPDEEEFHGRDKVKQTKIIDRSKPSNVGKGSKEKRKGGEKAGKLIEASTQMDSSPPKPERGGRRALEHDSTMESLMQKAIGPSSRKYGVNMTTTEVLPTTKVTNEEPLPSKPSKQGGRTALNRDSIIESIARKAAESVRKSARHKTNTEH